MKLLPVADGRRETRRSIAALALTAGILSSSLLVLTGCNRDAAGLLDRMKEFEIAEYKGRDLSRATVEELEAGIAAYRREVERKVDAADKIGVYRKLLGIRYLDMEMYSLAYEQFREALTIYPSNYILAYYAGVCLARTAKAEPDEDERATLFRGAEHHYLTAIGYSNDYTDALYALSILYVFELGRPEDAEGYLLRLLAKQSLHFDAMFLLARAYVQMGRIAEAERYYRKIADDTNDSVKRNEAEKNISILRGVSQ